MSLLFRRRTIARAVGGDLPPAAEDRLRAHLRRCPSCRAHYDRLSVMMEAVSAAGSERAADRERVQLERALAAPAPRADAPRPHSRRAWLIAGVVLAPAAALLLWVGGAPERHDHPDSAPAADVGLRGTDDPTNDAAAGPVLIVYASRRSEGARAPLRLAGEVPGSGTVRVSRADYLQFGVRGLTSAAAVSISALGASGATHVFFPRPGGAAPRTTAGTHPAAIGPSFDLAQEPAPGRYQLTARFSPLSASDGGTLDAPAIVVSASLIIEP